VHELTRDLQPELLKLLYNDFEFFLSMKKEEKEAQFSSTDIDEAIEKLTTAGKSIPTKEIPDFNYFKKGMSKDEIKDLPKLRFLDKEKLLFPFDFFCSYRFKAMLKEKLANSEAVHLTQGKQQELASSSHLGTDNLEKAFEEQGLWELPITQKMNHSARATLINNIRNSDLPLQIALLSAIGFTESKNHPKIRTNVGVYEMIARLLGTNSRTIKGNINVLNSNSKEDKKRYTSHLHQQRAQEIIKNIK